MDSAGSATVRGKQLFEPEYGVYPMFAFSHIAWKTANVSTVRTAASAASRAMILTKM